MFRCRVEKDLLRKAHKISDEMGTSTSELVRIFIKTLVKQRRLPFDLTAESEADQIVGPIARRREVLDLFE